mgnify:CR=1 FL=1
MKIFNFFNKEIINVVCIDNYGNQIKGDFIESPFFKGFICNIITDDFGDVIYIHYTSIYHKDSILYYIKGNITQYNGTVVGSIIPNLNTKSLIFKSELNNHKISIKEFNEFERNCNTCANLIRIKHEKCTSGLLKGKCNGSKISSFKYPLIIKNDEIHFYPQDYMDMICYTSRN